MLQVAMKWIRNPHDGAHALKFPLTDGLLSVWQQRGKIRTTKIGCLRVSKAKGDQSLDLQRDFALLPPR
jgi:hypothetical protein